MAFYDIQQLPFPLQQSSVNDVRKVLAGYARYAASRPVLQLALVSFLAVDLVFIALNAGMWTKTIPYIHAINMNYDGTWPERWEGAKLLATAALLVLVTVRQRRLLPAVLALGLAYVTLDNLFHLHESVGRRLISEQFWGELIVFGLLGAGFLGAMAYSILQGDKACRHLAILFIGIVGLFAVFAVGVDLIHSFAQQDASNPFELPLRLIEEGGEMMALSFAPVGVFMLCDRLGLFQMRHAAETPGAERR
ncbi:hypothetical protein [Parvularcula sp. LCG005]|uniref:hypothetical protein n=1 Tax=Parvularcula sp. LCG005 TaxID=3078805 RepID=UPI00294204AC|nr:hypothetical protein [Parvularcula sp. LCG005]WOI54674.1 hypothetical protein RUI03_06645 [Parvularcula sp. LCG005]